MKHFSSKDTIKTPRRQALEWGTFAFHLSNEGPVSTLYRDFSVKKKKKKRQTIQKKIGTSQKRIFNHVSM